MALDENIGNFTYSSTPQPIRPKSKYRNDSNSIPVVNLMSDPRVIRGSAATKAKSTIEQAKNASNNKKLLLTKSLKQIENHEIRSDPSYNFVYKTATNEAFDLSAYLVDQSELVVSKKVDNKAQTDEFDEYIVQPPYIPRKTGIDASTQVEDTAELFSFDLEVEPIVQVIVNKTIEQAKLELFNEDTLSYLFETRTKYLADLAAHEEWMRSEERKTIDKYKNSLTIMNDYIAQHEELVRIRTYVAGLQMSQQIYQSMVNNVISQCYESKLWNDSEKDYIYKYIIPELIDKVKSNQHSYDISTNLVDEILIQASTNYEETQPIVNTPSKITTIDVFTSLTRAEINENQDEEEVNQITEKVLLGSYPIDNITTVLKLYKNIRDALRDRSLSLEVVSVDIIKQFFFSILNRDVTDDGCLTNFDLPSKLTIIL
eukprot:gene19640-25551_t